MKTITHLHAIASQIPDEIRDQFQIALVSDPFFLAPVARFKHAGGTVIEERLATKEGDGYPILSDDVIAKLYLISK